LRSLHALPHIQVMSCIWDLSSQMISNPLPSLATAGSATAGLSAAGLTAGATPGRVATAGPATACPSAAGLTAGSATAGVSPGRATDGMAALLSPLTSAAIIPTAGPATAGAAPGRAAGGLVAARPRPISLHLQPSLTVGSLHSMAHVCAVVDSIRSTCSPEGSGPVTLAEIRCGQCTGGRD